jgi:hypothetical protein
MPETAAGGWLLDDHGTDVYERYAQVVTKEWNEADHPRVPAGSPGGGQFTSGATAAGNPYLPGMERGETRDEVNAPWGPHANWQTPMQFRMDGGRLQYLDDRNEWRDYSRQPGDWRITATGGEEVLEADGQWHPVPLKYVEHDGAGGVFGEVWYREGSFGEWKVSDDQLGALHVQDGDVYELKLGSGDVPAWVKSEDQLGDMRTGDNGHREQLVGMGPDTPQWEQVAFTPSEPAEDEDIPEPLDSMDPDPDLRPESVRPDDDADQAALMREGVTRIKPLGGGVTRSYKVTMTDGSRGVWKPEQSGWRGLDHGEHISDAAAYDLAKAVGYADLVAPTVVRKINGVEGSLQKWTGGEFPGDADYDKADGERAVSLDFVFNNPDRHEGNWFIANGKPMLIDSGRAFPRSSRGPGGLEEWFSNAREPVSATVAEDWGKVLADRPRVELVLRRNGMGRDAVDAAFDRIQVIVDGQKRGEMWSDLSL